MSIRKKILVLLIGLVILITGGFALLLRNEIRVSHLLLRKEVQDKQQLFDRVFAFTSRSMELLVQDYSLWDEMVAYVRAKHDLAWANEEVGGILETYNVNAVWISDRQGRIRYVKCTIPGVSYQTLLLPPAAFSRLFSQRKTCHFYLPTAAGLLDVQGATIQPTGDTQRQMQPAGYFFVARILDQHTVSELSRLVGGTVALHLRSAPDYPAASLPAGTIGFTRDLPGWDGVPCARLAITYRTELLDILKRFSNQNLAVSIIVLILIIAILAIALFRWVSQPLAAIAQALKDDDTSRIRHLFARPTEIGQLARLVAESFEQKHDLLREIVERLHAENELEHAHERFRIAAESASDLIYEWNSATGAMEWYGDIDSKLGYEEGEFPRTRAAWEERIHLEDRPVVREAIGRHQRGTTPLYAEYRLSTKDGAALFVTDRGRFLSEEQDAGQIFIGVISDITSRKQMEEELRSLSVSDPLTGLYNRRGFIALAEGQVKIAQQKNEHVIIFYADLDGLKQVNDTYGHAAGDDMIVQSAAVLRKSFRQSDIIARMGGDEFAVLAVVAQPSDFDIIHTRLLKSITAFNAPAHHLYTLSMSIGVVRCEAQAACAMENLLAQADQAMYAQKRLRKSRT